MTSISVFLLILIPATICSAKLNRAGHQKNLITYNIGTCSADTDKSQEERFDCADVVFTGTIVTLDRPGSRDNVSSPEYVKIWNVLKPHNRSLSDFIDGKLQRKVRKIISKRDAGDKPKSRKYSKKFAIIGSEKPNQPILEIYGLYNREFGGSILQEGDTRVFFLRSHKRIAQVAKSKRSVAMVVEKKKPSKAERRRRKRRRLLPSSLLNLENLLPARVSMRVLTELDNLAKESSQSSVYHFTTQSSKL